MHDLCDLVERRVDIWVGIHPSEDNVSCIVSLYRLPKTADEVVLEKVLHKPFVVVVKDTLVLLDSLIFEDIKKELIAVF